MQVYHSKLQDNESYTESLPFKKKKTERPQTGEMAGVMNSGCSRIQGTEDFIANTHM